MSRRLAESKRPPFEILVSTVLSLRTLDVTTAEASARLFERARTPEALLRLGEKEIALLIYPVGFYNVKARQLAAISQILIEQHEGRTPDSLEELLALPGVGRKTANLVLTLGHGLPGICVDTHVHRIANRWGYVKTRTPNETEFALRKVLPKRFWIPINDWLVSLRTANLPPALAEVQRVPAGRDLPADWCGEVAVRKHFHRRWGQSPIFRRIPWQE